MSDEMTLFEKLKKANADYHEAANDILCDEAFIIDMEARTEVKALFGACIKQVFHQMHLAEDTIKEYYEVQ